MGAKFKVGDAVVIWRESHGAGIYDGNTNYVREVNDNGTRYGLSDINEGRTRGWMPEETLLSQTDFAKLVVNGDVKSLWQGDSDKLQRLLKRYNQ